MGIRKLTVEKKMAMGGSAALLLAIVLALALGCQSKGEDATEEEGQTPENPGSSNRTESTSGETTPPSGGESLSGSITRAEDFGYIRNQNNDGVIVTYWTSSATNIIIPDTLDGLPVTGFINNLFTGRNITGVSLPDTIRQIPNAAFRGCTSLTMVKLSATLEAISNEAFYGCTRLGTIEIPASVTSIGNDAFGNCSGLTRVVIPESVRTIGNSAFSDCDKLTNVVIPATTTIGNYAFWDCDGLTSVVMTASVTTIGEGAFYSCGNLAKVTLPNSLTTLGRAAFSNCWNLIELNVPASLTTFDNRSLYRYGDIGYIFTRCHKLPLAVRAQLVAQGYNGTGF